jgi:hypothetical protein
MVGSFGQRNPSADEMEVQDWLFDGARVCPWHKTYMYLRSTESTEYVLQIRVEYQDSPV